jgi:AbrB family looped-hinge helix DNA binding protein
MPRRIGITFLGLFGPSTRQRSQGTFRSKKLTNLIEHIIVIQNRIDGGFGMQTVTVSPKYQVVIPKAMREALHLRPGQKMQVIEYGGRIDLVPERDIKELRGFVKGINTEFEREEDRV